MPARLTVKLGDRSYPIAISHGHAGGFGAFCREALERTWAGRGCDRVVIVTDANVDSLIPPFAASLAECGIRAEKIVVEAGETTKSLAHASAIYDQLIELKANRRTPIVAIGGGVIGDLAGFVAATFVRGVPLLMVPTTLLSQVDSSVGGKVGVNHPLAKNIIGAFHQPAGVWIDTAILRSLPEREIRSGFAEVIKYGMIWSEIFFAELEAKVADVLELEPEAVASAAATSCSIKAEVVAGDEREESGLRAILNYGHTAGHAIEAVAGYGGLLHGEAVAVGMIVEAELARRIGWLEESAVARLQKLIRRAGLPETAAGLDPGALERAMSRDKKNRSGRIAFVLPRKVGAVELCEDVPERELRAAIESVTRG